MSPGEARTLVLACGVHSLGFAAFHLAFWRLFDWPRDLQSCTLATRAITQILNLRLTYVFLAVGLACLLMADDVIGTRLGRAMLGALSLFWVGRTIEQVVFLRVRHVAVHVLTALFVVGALMAALPLIAAR